MFRDKGPLWIYEEEDLTFNAEPGVVRFGAKRNFLNFLMPIFVFLIGAMDRCSSKIMWFIIMKK